MDYDKILENYLLKNEEIEKAIRFIEQNIEQKDIKFDLIKSEFDFTKPQFYFSLYNFLIYSGYLSKDEPDDELLVKITKRDMFKKMKLPFEERREFLGFVIIYINHKFGISFSDQVIQMNTTDNQFDYFQIQHEMTNALPYMKISNIDLLTIIEHFAVQAEQDMTVGEVYNSCLKFCSENPKQGWELVDFMIKEKNTRFLVNALHGLSIVDFSKTFNFSKSLYESEKKPDIIIYYGYLNYSDLNDINYVLDLLETELNNENKEIEKALSKCFSNIVYHSLIKKNNLEERIFKNISLIASKKTPEALYNILSTLTFRKEKDGYEHYKQSLLQYYYDVPIKYKGIVIDLAHYLHNLKKPKIVLSFIENWILKHELIKDLDDFDYALNDSYESDPKEFIEEYIKLIIHSEAKVRKAAKTLFSIVKLNKKNIEHWIESIKKLSLIQQQYLFISLKEYSIGIKEQLKVAALLIKTHTPKIYNFILQEFVWLINDYGNLILKIVSETVDKEVKVEKNFEEGIAHFTEEINSIWKKKADVKEIDPRLTQAKILNKFNEIYYKKQNEFISNYKSDKTPFLNMITKVQIGRGRMFKMGDNAAPGYMSKFETSFILPRTLFVFPEQYDFLWNQDQNRDWE